MPYIPIINNTPGIVGLLETYTDTGKVLRNLADILLNKNSNAFNKAERETVASYISFLNNCNFCYKSHSAIADCLWKKKGKTKEIINKIEKQNVSSNNDNNGNNDNNDNNDKIETLLYIAKKLHASPQGIKQEDINLLKVFDFTPDDINDLILIISSFCMFNRYVDGLGTFYSLDDEMYNTMGEKIACNGYII